MKKKSPKKSRHPTRKKSVQPTPSVPTVAIGKRNRELLKYLLHNENKRLNIKEYSRITKIPRSSIYETLKSLEKKDLIKRSLGDNKINEKGRLYLNYSGTRGVGSSRWGCRELDKLSTHYNKFKLPIIDRKNFRIEKLERLNHKGVKENRLHNLHQIIIDFEDAKIIINPKQVIISLFEFIGDNVEDSDIKSLSRAVDYAERLMKIGVVTGGVMVEEGHWARMESVLSNFLYDKVDKRYFLTLNDGSKFFIDHSGGGIEDETDSKVVRQRVDNFLNQVASNDFDLTDINKIKESLGFITKLESVRLMDNIEENKLKRNKLGIENKGIKDISPPSYCG